MATKERSVSLYAGYLKRLDNTTPGTNIEIDSDVKAVMRFIKDDLVWNRAEAMNAYMVKGDLTYALKIHEVNDGLNLIKGQFATIDSSIIPQYEWNGDVSSLELPSEDAGLYYPSHFVYFVEHQHLVVEYNQSGPRISSLQDYLEEKSALSPTPILNRAFFQEVFRNDVIEAIERMGSVAEISVEVRKDSLELLRNSGVDDVLNLETALIPDNAVVKFSISREKRASSGAIIEKETILAWLRRRIGLANADNPNLRIRARVEDRPDDSGASIWLDLLSAKYKSKIRVKLNKDRSVNSESCYERLQQAYTTMIN